MPPTLDALALRALRPGRPAGPLRQGLCGRGRRRRARPRRRRVAGRQGRGPRALLAARDFIAAAACPVLVRVNAAGTPWHAEDLAAAASLPLAGVLLPKAETAAAVAETARATGRPVLALVESARGVAAVRFLAEAAARLAFGAIDLSADLGCADERDALLAFRSELVLASRLAGRPAPLDGVTPGYRDPGTGRGRCPATRHASASAASS